MIQNGTVFEGEFVRNVCASTGKFLYANGDIYYGQHKAFAREGQGKMIYLDGSTYEGGWLNDKRHLQGKNFDSKSGDIYIGNYQDGKRSGKGRYFYADQNELYDGDWSNDRRQGEGYLIDHKGTIRKGDFRADHMEAKVAHVKTLSLELTNKLFELIKSQNDLYFTIAKADSKVRMEPCTSTLRDQINAQFDRVRKALLR